MKEEKAMTLIALVITIILMLILATVGIKISRKAIDRTQLESLKTNMLLIQGKAKTINEKFIFKDIEKLVGVKTEENTQYEINANLQAIIGTSECYILEPKDLEDNGLSNIKIDNKKFYIVDYASNEVYYSLGYTQNGTTYYKLSEIQKLK